MKAFSSVEREFPTLSNVHFLFHASKHTQDLHGHTGVVAQLAGRPNFRRFILPASNSVSCFLRRKYTCRRINQRCRQDESGLVPRFDAIEFDLISLCVE